MNVWCDLLNDQPTGTCVPYGQLTLYYYPHFLQDKLPLILEDIPLQARLNMWLQYDSTERHFGLQVIQFLNRCYGKHATGHAGQYALPPHSLDWTPLAFHLLGLTQNFV
jgi:hypothetical protein